MRTHFTAPPRKSLTSRFFGGAMMMLILVGVSIVPLCSAFSLGTMPCCHQTSSPMTSTASQPPCCAINRSAAGNEPIAISRAVTSQRTLDTVESAADLTFAPAPNAPVTTDLAWQVFRPLQRRLHIRNSVFLI